MLTILRIKNLALVADLTLELQPGYNAITGETGAGKSILIGALNLALGERADRALIRSGADACAVEAIFDLRKFEFPLDRFLAENGIEPVEDGLLILKRTLSTTGANRQFINGSPATLGTLAALGNWLVDIHGPHDHQSLLRPAQQLALLDAFGKLELLRNTFTGSARGLAELASAKAALIVDDATYARQLDLLRYQVREIEAAQLRPDEEEELQIEYHRASNGARLLELGQAASRQLEENDESLLNAMEHLGRVVLDLKRLDSAAEPLAAFHEQAAALLRELKGELARYLDHLAVDPARLQHLEERLNVLQSLKRKYGHDLSNVIGYGQKAARELQSLEDRESQLSRLNQESLQLSLKLQGIGQQLSAARRRLIPTLQQLVSDQLAQLGFRRSLFEIALVTAPAPSVGDPALPALSTGYDQVDFQFAPNPGEPPRPLRAIASSGEMARVMLALKTVLATQDAVPVLIFDEVDANIGGDTAQNVGQKMREIGQHRQVLCITHLAPVAACATAHFVVTKSTQLGRTTTQIARLEGAGRIDELGRMLGGPDAAARRHAQALLDVAQKPESFSKARPRRST